MSVTDPSTSSSTAASKRMEDTLPKRKRKRTRSRKNKGGPNDTEDHVDDEEAPVQEQEKTSAAAVATEQSHPPAPVEEANEKKQEVDKDSDDEDQDEEDGAGTEAGGKKKRKRNRKRSKKGNADVEGITSSDSGSKIADKSSSTQNGSANHKVPAVASQGAGFSSLQADLAASNVENPEMDGNLAEGSAKRAALHYAYLHHTSRDKWKFQKAKEAWLLRHLLSVPMTTQPSHESDTQTKQTESSEPNHTRTDTISGEGQQDDDATSTPQIDHSISDQYLPLVVNYLSTMQGKSKERLVADLQKVVEEGKSLPPPVEAAEEQAVAAPETPGSTSTTTTKKTVSFADVADEQNQREQGESSESSSREDLRWKSARAEKVLHWLL